MREQYADIEEDEEQSSMLQTNSYVNESNSFRSTEFASFLVYGMLPIFHTIISKTCYLAVPYYLSDTFDEKNWQVSKVYALLFAFTLNNVFDTASGYMNLELTYVSLFNQHVFMILIGLISGIMFCIVDYLKRPLLVTSFAAGICGFSKGNNLLDVYIREIVPIDQAKQNRYTAHIAKSLPFGYFLGYTATGFIYQRLGMKGFGAFVTICSALSIICLILLRPYVSQVVAIKFDSSIENETEFKTNPWTPTMKTIMLTRFWSALADEMYYLIGPIIMYSFVSSAGFGLICGFAQLFTACFSYFTHDPEFAFPLLHYPYIQVVVSFFTIGSFIGLRFTKTTIVACICQFYWVFSHLYIRTSVNTERSAMALNLDINEVSAISNIVETIGFIFGSSLGMLFVEAVGFYDGLYAPAGVYAFNIAMYIFFYYYRIASLSKKILCQRESLEILSVQSDCALTRQASLSFLSEDDRRATSSPIALMERLLAHALKHMPEPLLKVLDAEESISLVGSVSESESIDIRKNLSKEQMIQILMDHSDLLMKFFQENEELKMLLEADLRRSRSKSSPDTSGLDMIVVE